MREGTTSHAPVADIGKSGDGTPSDGSISLGYVKGVFADTGILVAAP